jgi:hypothetical protein
MITGRLPSPDSTAAIILGAAEFPNASQFEAAPQFRNSAKEFRAFLLAPDGFRLSEANLLDLFDTPDEQPVIVRKIANFLLATRKALEAKGSALSDVIFYYVGHGGFDTSASSTYFLAIKQTDVVDYLASSLAISSLRRALREHSNDARHYLILDCCFAAAALAPYVNLSSTAQAMVTQVQDAFPPSGTALLCASGAVIPARAKRGETFTMFSGALLDVLCKGAANSPSTFSLGELGFAVRSLLKSRYGDEAVRPEVHSPEQSKGSVADVPIFRNAFSQSEPGMAVLPKDILVKEREPTAAIVSSKLSPAATTRQTQAAEQRRQQKEEAEELAKAPPRRTTPISVLLSIVLIGTVALSRISETVVGPSAVSEILRNYDFVVGAMLLTIYQAAKFAELNLNDPITSRYVALLPKATARDFAGSWAYYTTLFAFLGVSLVVYFFLCRILPDLFTGAMRLFVGEPSATLKDIPYPLYIAAMYIGLSLPVIPIFSQFVNAQRDIFHNLMNVPRWVIDYSEFLTRTIYLRSGADRRRLANEVRNLASGDFVTSLRSYGDGAYYNLQLEKLALGDEDTLGRTIKGSSANKLRGLTERLVLCALVAGMRRSGPNSLVIVAISLGVPVPAVPTNNTGYLITSFVSSTVLFALALLILANIFALLVGPVATLFPNQPERLWPEDLSNVIAELWYIVPPIFISLLVAIFFLVPRNRSQSRDLESNHESSLGAEFVDFFRSSAVVLGTCIAITVLIQIGQWLYEYGISNEQPVPRTASQLFLPLIQSFISVAVCLFTTWYLVSASTHPPRRGLSFTATLLAIVATTALIGFFYEITFVQDYVHSHPKAAPGWDHVLFGVIANVLVSVCAFLSVVLFFAPRERGA